MSQGHSLLSPSKAHRWIHCPGSVFLCKDTPDEISEVAEEGTLAHSLAEKCLKKNFDPLAVIENMEMASAVDDYVREVRKNTKNAVELEYELFVDLSFVLGLTGEGGTADCVAVVPLDAGQFELQIHDLKYGKGVLVSAYQNEQLMLYALGALCKYDLVYKITNIKLFIHQPRRNDEPSEWALSIDELNEFQENAAFSASKALLPGTPTPIMFTPGEKQCKFCPAKKIGKCEAFEKYAMRTLIDDFDVITDDIPVKVEKAVGAVELYDNDKLAKIYSQLGMVHMFVKNIEDRVFKELSNGGIVPGYKLVKGKSGNRKWKDEKAVEKVLSSIVPKDKIYEKSLISVAAAEKILKKKSEAWLKISEEHVERADGKIVIASESDPRERVEQINIDDFEVLE